MCRRCVVRASVLLCIGVGGVLELGSHFASLVGDVVVARRIVAGNRSATKFMSATIIVIEAMI